MGIEEGARKYGAIPNALAMEAMVLIIRGDLGTKHVPVSDTRDASAKYRQYVESNDLGASDVDFGEVVMGGRKVATISYNGKVILDA